MLSPSYLPHFRWPSRSSAFDISMVFISDLFSVQFMHTSRSQILKKNSTLRSCRSANEHPRFPAAARQTIKIYDQRRPGSRVTPSRAATADSVDDCSGVKPPSGKNSNVKGRLTWRWMLTAWAANGELRGPFLVEDLTDLNGGG